MAEVVVTPREADAQWLLHCAPGDAAATGAALGVGLGAAMLRAAAGGGWHALHLAPDEWLLVAPAGSKLGTAGAPHALVDISDRSLGVDIIGADAPAALNAACPLDLGDAAFPVGMCTRTLFGKVMVMLWRTSAVTWRMDYARSFDGYVTGLLALAVADADD